MATNELACVYAALILHDDGVEITADKIAKIVAAAGVEVEPIWPNLFARALKGKNLDDYISAVGAAGAAPAAAPAAAAPAASAAAEEKKEEKKKEEKKEESDDDMGFGLFD